MSKMHKHHLERTSITTCYLKIRRARRPKYLFMNKLCHLYPYAIRSPEAKAAHADPEMSFIGLYNNTVDKQDLTDDINTEIQTRRDK